MDLALLVSARAKSAFFEEFLQVSEAELQWHLPSAEIRHKRIGGMDFLEVEADLEALGLIARLSFVQGILQRQGEALIPLDIEPSFLLHEDFVYGSKFKGKTNETLTQMMINVGLRALGEVDASQVKLLDPMCGRGTTLLWAMRYGMRAKGIELDPQALVEARQMIKKWTKLRRQKHELKEGFVGAKPKSGLAGKFLEFQSEGAGLSMIVGDAADTAKLLKGERFHLIVSDLPYGVQHLSAKKTRNPLASLEAAASAWVESLKPGGVMVLAFNGNNPKREELIGLFAELPMELLEFSATHRMSESIVREIVIFRKGKD